MNTTVAHTVPRRTLTGSALLWLTLGLVLAWEVGAHVDARYHIHYGDVIESFFAWPHALLYGSWVSTGLVVAFHLWLNRAHPTKIPRGYWIVLIGVALFALGGAFDLLWHSLFGFEVDLETLFSLLPGGTIAIMMVWEGLLVVGSTDLWVYLPAVAGAALLGEAIWAWVWRGGLGGPEGAGGYWLLAFLVPLAQSFFYFGLMAAFGGGIIWTTHLWAGSAVMAGIYGLIASLFVIPPRFIHAGLPPRRT